MQHRHIEPSSPQANGKVERSHRTDKAEFYQLLSKKGDVDIQKKLAEWEHFFEYQRPHAAPRGKTPYESPTDEVR